jgi:flagellar hook-basal body complex protein FliE
MNDISPQQLLTQIRAMHAELQSLPSGQTASTRQTGFGALLSDAVNQVNETQMRAGAIKQDFETGKGDASLAEVMIASQKAGLSFRAMTEVRNKLVTAYQEIMNMPV